MTCVRIFNNRLDSFNALTLLMHTDLQTFFGATILPSLYLEEYDYTKEKVNLI